MKSNNVQAAHALPRYTLHTVPIHFQVEDEDASRRLIRQWQPFYQKDAPDEAAIKIKLSVVDKAPAAPDMPMVSAGPDVTYFRQGDMLVVLFPGWGSLRVNLASERILGIMARAAINAYGIFEEMILIALAPLLRRRGYYTVHAFAAAMAGRAILILGDTGAGKTTTGISLLANGAQLVANDTPLLRMTAGEKPALHAYPGLLSAYPDSLARFPQLEHLRIAGLRLDGSAKISFAADAVWPEIWACCAQPAALVFPQITSGIRQSHLRAMTSLEALRRLISQSIEDWDIETIPSHLQALSQLVQEVPAYQLYLAPDIHQLPNLLLPLLYQHKN